MKTFLALVLLWPQESDPFQGLWKKVELDVKEVDTRAAFEELFKQAGTVLSLPDFPEKKITYRANGVSFWQAVDDLCRLNGGLRHPLHPYMEQHRLDLSPWIEYPAAYQGPLRLAVFDAARIREVRYPGRGDRTDLTFILQWTGSFEPIRGSLGRAGGLRLARLEDDTGRSLLPEIKVPLDFEVGHAGWTGTPACYWILHFGAAGAGARKIARIDAEWEGTFLRDVEEVVFDNPVESVGKAKKVGPMSLVLASFAKEKGLLVDEDFPSYDFVLRLSFDPAAAPKEWQDSLKAVPLQKRLVHTFEAALVSAGQELRLKRQSLYEGKSEPAWAELTGNVTLGRDRSLSTLSVRLAKGVGSGKASFSFKDVKLPEEGR